MRDPNSVSRDSKKNPRDHINWFKFAPLPEKSKKLATKPYNIGPRLINKELTSLFNESYIEGCEITGLKLLKRTIGVCSTTPFFCPCARFDRPNSQIKQTPPSTFLKNQPIPGPPTRTLSERQNVFLQNRQRLENLIKN